MELVSLKFKAAVLLCTLIIVTELVFGCFSFANTKTNLLKKYNNEAQLVLANTVMMLNKDFDSVESVLREMILIHVTKDSAAFFDISKSLTLVQKAIPRSSALLLGLIDGRYFFAPNLVMPSTYDPREQKWYTLAKLSPGIIVWTDPYLDYLNQRIIITAAGQLASAVNNPEGVIAVHFNVSELNKEICTQQIGEEGIVMILNKNGTVIANRDNYGIGEKIFGDDFDKVVSAQKSGQMEYIINKKPYILHFNTLHNNGMVLVAGISLDEINKDVLMNNLPILISGGICLLVFALIAYFSALKGIAPIHNLITLMNKAENGDYQVYADHKEYVEINSLACSFNSMIESIRIRDEQLIESNKELALTEEKLWIQYTQLKESQITLQNNEKRIKYLAYNDSLTGLANRERLIYMLQENVRAAILDNKIGAVIFIDLDNFKKINDTKGHSIGDQVLVAISKRFLNFARDNAVVARIGGDEFIIVINNISSVAIITENAEELVKLFDDPISMGKTNYTVSASIGITLFPSDATSVEELLKKADMAMYRAKAKGKNCYQIFDDSMQKDFIFKVEIENNLRLALKNEELTLHYQPKYRASDSSIYGFEALLRWNSPLLGMVSALEIVRIAEETGLIVKLEKWVFKTACLLVRLINTNNSNPLKMSVNISAIHIMHKDFVKNIKMIIAETKVNPQWLELEITETVMRESFHSNKDKLMNLKEFGLDIHLDDFGSGYSSLNYLQNLPIDYVKIDKLFIDSMLKSEKNCSVTAAIVDLVHKMGLKVIAEGVEKQEQLEILKHYECDLIQGYLFSKPLPQDEILRLHTKQNETISDVIGL